jgi:hypothetical protein
MPKVGHFHLADPLGQPMQPYSTPDLDIGLLYPLDCQSASKFDPPYCLI